MTGRFVCPDCGAEMSAEEFDDRATAAGIPRDEPVEMLCGCDDEVRMEWREDPVATTREESHG